MTTIRLAFKRLRARPLLTALLVVGLSLMVALPTAIPAYSDATPRSYTVRATLLAIASATRSGGV